MIILTKWTMEQKEAIEKKGENIIVSAGAGSGKTAAPADPDQTSRRAGGGYAGTVALY